MKLVSHIRPSHMDDFLALSIAKYFIDDAEIEYLEFDNPLLEEYKNSKDVILIDIGRDYNPDLLNFDHHHNADLNCSLHLVMQYFDKDFYNKYKDSEVLYIFDYIDRYGPLGLNLSIDGLINWKRKMISIFADINVYYKDIIVAFISNLKKYSHNYEYFIANFVEDLDHVYNAYLNEIEQLKIEYNNKLQNSLLAQENDVNILLSDTTLSPFHFKTLYKYNIDIIIEKSRGNENHTALFRKDINRFNFDALEQYAPIIFKHNSKFLYVIDKNFNQIIEDFDNIKQLLLSN